MSVLSGLLALMLAQRTADDSVPIDAVELDAGAAMQAQENVAFTLFWPHRITVHTDDIQRWAPRQTVRTNLIISNPALLRTRWWNAPRRSRSRRVTPLRWIARRYWLLRRIVLPKMALRSLAGTNR